MHYKNGRPAKVGDWVIGKTHNSDGNVRVCYVKNLMPGGGSCNVKLHFWPTYHDQIGGKREVYEPWEKNGQEDYAFTADLVHVLDGYRLATICSDAWKWDSEINPAPRLAQSYP